MTVLEMLGKYVQQSLTTVTPKVIAVNVANVVYGHKRARSLWCLSLCLLAGAGGGAAFAIDSVPYAYFSPIVLKALPFLGEVGAKIAVGTIGFWICGAFGHNAAKFTAQEFNRRAHGHSNSAYIFNDEDVQRIMRANPQAYAQALQAAEAEDIEAGAPQPADAAELKEFMLHLRNQIDSHRENRAEHDKYKRALLGLLRQSTLRPALEAIAADRAERQVRMNWAANMARFFTDGQAAEGAQSAAPQLMVERSEGSSSQEEIEMRHEPILPVVGNHPPLQELPLREGVRGLAHMSREIKTLNSKRFFSFSRHTKASAVKPLSQAKTREVLTGLRQAHESQGRKQEEDLTYVPRSLRRILGF